MGYRLGDIGRIVTGKTPSTNQSENFSYFEDKYMFLTPKDMKDELKYIRKTERYLTERVTDNFKSMILESGSVCISCIGSDMGKVYLIDRKTVTNQQINSITDIKSFCNSEYLYYYFRGKKEFLKGIAGGSTMPVLNKTLFSDIILDLPSKVVQDKIVNILKYIDSKIELNNKINNNLQEIIRSLYIEKFSNKRYNGKIEDILKLKKDNIKVKDIDDTLNYYPIDTLPMNYLVLKEGKSIKEANSSLQKFLKYDILLGSMRVYFHRVCLASNDGITRNTTFVMMPIQDIHLYYCLLTLDKNDFIDYASKTSKGSTMPYAVWEAIAKYEVYIPTKDELEDFNRAVSVSLEKMMSNECENENLIKLRDTLLPKLMNGEIDLENIEI